MRFRLCLCFGLKYSTQTCGLSVFGHGSVETRPSQRVRRNIMPMRLLPAAADFLLLWLIMIFGRPGWGLEALFEACACNSQFDDVGVSQAESASIGLWVIAGCGTVQHQDTHGAQRFSKRRKKGIAEKIYYASAAEAAAGGPHRFKMCRLSAKAQEKVSFKIRSTAVRGQKDEPVISTLIAVS